MVPDFVEYPFKIFKADNGGIIFDMMVTSTTDPPSSFYIAMIAKECPHTVVYKIKFDYPKQKITFEKGKEKKVVEMNETIFPCESRTLWLSWYNNHIKMGVMDNSQHQDPFVEYEETFSDENPKVLIGYVRFEKTLRLDWKVQSAPFKLKPQSFKKINGGVLRWASMVNAELPTDAFIGGFEYEPIYIARSRVDNSVYPGKYVPTKGSAYVPWQNMEIRSNYFEILCGFNAAWIKCKENEVPENLIITDESEVNNAKKYIGRAMIKNNLVIGNVQILYKTCKLPYKGKAVKTSTYEILVDGNGDTSGIPCNKLCVLNPMKANQPCM